jgi:hypothetical protein
MGQQSPNTKLTTKNFFIGLLTLKQDNLLGTAVLASLLNKPNKSQSKQSTKDDKTIEDISKYTNDLYNYVDQTISKISKFTHNLSSLAKRSTRLPRATKSIKNLEATIAMFTPSKTTVSYHILNYATRNQCWRCTPIQDHRTIQELLLKDIHSYVAKEKLPIG